MPLRPDEGVVYRICVLCSRLVRSYFLADVWTYSYSASISRGALNYSCVLMNVIWISLVFCVFNWLPVVPSNPLKQQSHTDANASNTLNDEIQFRALWFAAWWMPFVLFDILKWWLKRLLLLLSHMRSYDFCLSETREWNEYCEQTLLWNLLCMHFCCLWHLFSVNYIQKYVSIRTCNEFQLIKIEFICLTFILRYMRCIE